MHVTSTNAIIVIFILIVNTPGSGSTVKSATSSSSSESGLRLTESVFRVLHLKEYILGEAGYHNASSVHFKSIHIHDRFVIS